MVQRRILVVEDDENIRDVCRRYMEREGYQVLLASDGQKGWELFQHCSPDLIVLDVMMPGRDGYQLCQEIREQSETPIIILTARGDEHDRLMGLTLGADDYITKPFSPRELILRLHNLFRRMRNIESHPIQHPAASILDFGTLVIDPVMRRVVIANEIVDLTVKEFDVLHVMAKRPGQVFSKGQLLDLVWGFDSSTDRSAVTVLIRRLREKIERTPSQPNWVHTVWGIGYRFEPKGESTS